MAKKFYAVKKGKKAGIYNSWDACKMQVHGYPGALYKSFLTKEEATAYIGGTEVRSSDVVDSGIRIYVDGSYIAGRYSWGFAVYDGNTLVYTKNGVGESADAAKLHNVAGEVEGTIQAVEWAKARGLAGIAIYHDYIGISEWAEKRWKTNNDITRNYAAYMEEHLQWVKFVKVSGHSGDEGNDLADRLAKDALGVK